MAQMTNAELGNLLGISEEDAAGIRARSERGREERDALVVLAAELGIEHRWVSPDSDWISMPKATYRAVLERLRDLERPSRQES